MTVRKRLSLAGCLLVLSVPVMASPGEHSDFGQPAPAASATRTVEVDMTDIAFNPKSLDVKAGETVHFVLVNKGQLLHEFNLGHAAMHAEHQKEMLEMQQSGMLTATGMNHVGMDHSAMGHGSMDMPGMKHDDPNSVLVEPGKTAELTWTFAKTDNLEFACNVPGHYQAGMVGQLKVAP
ncbi:cupredoxin family protein [Pseudomonas sp. CCC3.1]|uniref:copper-resistant cuproprotein CopI n=1 Tax=Pseudomonas sp. CCC3.1 TaxID=3048607 RepID=UPI002AC8A60E|nr:cupredoxin family protein [Pseudomonas sp. CCC3.1]MEB0208830.1 cupredoxin family protein [Pseudomonas sp. CCC3.1]WPX37555.1 cupredoxin family protein [Pseudomonas sp. CCC3.1]